MTKMSVDHHGQTFRFLRRSKSQTWLAVLKYLNLFPVFFQAKSSEGEIGEKGLTRKGMTSLNDHTVYGGMPLGVPTFLLGIG